MKIVQSGTGARPVTLYDFEPTPEHFCREVFRGLSADPKKLPPKYLYDDRGAMLFERITELETYYPTRTETGILRDNAREIADRLGSGVRLVEFGSGSGEKTWILLRHLHDPAAYVPVDISRTQLLEFALGVAAEFPSMEVQPVCADYTRSFHLPEPRSDEDRTVAFFPGSTIGNFEAVEAQAFLASVRRLVGPGGRLLIGIDLLKDTAVIEQAYNDPEGVTADFNLNLLRRINRECNADFDLDRFQHQAFFDRDNNRIEMRLVSEVDQVVQLCTDPENGAPAAIRFAAGEHITTEYSHKYDLATFTSWVRAVDWRVEQVWTDDRQWFAVVLLG